MDNQHRHIKGYRDLTPEDIQLINDIKTSERALLVSISSLQQHLNRQRATAQSLLDSREDHLKTLATQICSQEELSAATAEFQEAQDEMARIDAAMPMRWLAIGKTHIEEGFMALVRSVAQPVNTGS